MITKKDLIERMKAREAAKEQKISPEVQKMTEGMVERWKKVGVKFDNQGSTDTERKAERVHKFVSILKEGSR
jgi:methionyl-tRNA synthetase